MSSLTHQINQSINEIFRMFVVLSRSNKLRDSVSFMLGAFSAYEETKLQFNGQSFIV